MSEVAIFAAGCFWGVEKAFSEVQGVLKAESGYAGGHTENPTYNEVCGHGTGHAEVVRVEFDPAVVSYEHLLDVFWAIHDPTQVDRQGPDIGDQYRSVIFATTDDQLKLAEQSRDAEQETLPVAIATQIDRAPTFYMAEDYHQKYFEDRGISCHLPRRTPRTALDGSALV